MAVLYVYGLFFVSKWLELRSVFRTLLPQQSKLWFSFLCRGVKNNQEVWVNVQRLIWRKGNHLSPLEFGGVYHETERKKKKKTHTVRWRKSKDKLFFPPVFCSQVKVASWWSVFFHPCEGVLPLWLTGPTQTEPERVTSVRLWGFDENSYCRD